MLFAFVTMIALFVAGVLKEELGWKGIVLSLLAAGVAMGAFVIFQWPPLYYIVVLAFIDIVLVFKIFKGDMNIPY